MRSITRADENCTVHRTPSSASSRCSRSKPDLAAKLRHLFRLSEAVEQIEVKSRRNSDNTNGHRSRQRPPPRFIYAQQKFHPFYCTKENAAPWGGARISGGVTLSSQFRFRTTQVLPNRIAPVFQHVVEDRILSVSRTAASCEVCLASPDQLMSCFPDENLGTIRRITHEMGIVLRVVTIGVVRAGKNPSHILGEVQKCTRQARYPRTVPEPPQTMRKTSYASPSRSGEPSAKIPQIRRTATTSSLLYSTYGSFFYPSARPLALFPFGGPSRRSPTS